MRSGNDAVSVDIIAEEMKEAGTCLYYKPQKADDPLERGHLTYDDFVLIVQTKLQKDFLAEFGRKFICLDSTHHAGKYQFLLYTLMVADEERSGLPVAHMITNREETEPIVDLFCSKVWENLEEDLSCGYIMTDDKDCLFNGIVSGFNWNGNQPQKLLCTWHLRKNVSDHSYRKMSDKTRAEYWYSRFTKCQELQNSADFTTSWDQLIKELSVEEEKEEKVIRGQDNNYLPLP